MLYLTCPICGIGADETAFRCGGEAHLTRPVSESGSDVSLDALNQYLNRSADVRGWIRELWLCADGCGSWFALLRHTGTHAVGRAYTLDSVPPPPPEEMP